MLFQRCWDGREPLLINGDIIPRSTIERWQDVGSHRLAFGDGVMWVTDGHPVDIINNMDKIEMTVSEYLDRIMSPEYDGDKIRLHTVLSDLPEPLIKDVVPVIEHLLSLAGVDYNFNLLPSDNGNSFRKVSLQAFAGRRTYTDSHEHGGYEALLIQVAGAKEVLLHRPTEKNRQALYAGGMHNWPNLSPVRFYAPDLKEYPNFVENDPTHTIVAAGEILYIPDGWFHAVAAHGDEFCASLTLFYETDESLMARAIKGGSEGVGREPEIQPRAGACDLG